MTRGAWLHVLLELAAYTVGAQWYFAARRHRAPPVPLTPFKFWAVLAGAMAGAAAGSKLLYVAQYWHALHAQPAWVWWSGKTVVGGLLGGLLGVECAKWLVEVRHSTGDAFVTPLLLGIAIGRIGCQFAGLEDLTYGAVTTLPWGWHYGDGPARHPVALYEVLGLGVMVLVLRQRQQVLARVPGDRFKAFMLGYLLLRVVLDGLKPPHAPTAAHQLSPSGFGPFSAIQWAGVAGWIYYLPTLRRWLGSGAK